MTFDKEPVDYEEPMGSVFNDLLSVIEDPTASSQAREGAAKRLDIALLSSQNAVTRWAEDFSASRHREAMTASSEQATADQKVAKSLTWATWVLAGSTIVLFVVTLLGVFHLV